MVFTESLEVQQEANKKNTEYEEKWKKYEENPDLAEQERKKANEVFTSKKSPEELKKIKQIVEKVEELENNPEYSEEHQDTLYEIATIMVEELENQEQIPESTKPVIEETTNQIWYIIENPNPEIENNKNKLWVEWVKEKIQSNLSLEPKQLQEKLNNKEKNIWQAKEIFFNKEQIWEYSQNPKSESSNSEILKNLWENIIKWEKIVDEDLTNILWNFVIEPWKESLKEYYLENPDIVEKALNNAFELQIELVKDWKVNYRTETVENLKNEILDDDKTNPLEKLQKFKELKAEVNTTIWSLAQKREKATTWVEKQKLQERKKELKAKYKKLNENPKKNKDKINEITEEAIKIDKQLKEKPKSWEVISWWGKIDINEKVPVPEAK